MAALFAAALCAVVCFPPARCACGTQAGARRKKARLFWLCAGLIFAAIYLLLRAGLNI
ncbi:MAG: hypothetical protein ACLS7Z_10175 [Christensenellales bacterium]